MDHWSQQLIVESWPILDSMPDHLPDIGAVNASSAVNASQHHLCERGLQPKAKKAKHFASSVPLVASAVEDLPFSLTVLSPYKDTSNSRAVRMTNTHKGVVSVVVSNDAPT